MKRRIVVVVALVVVVVGGVVLWRTLAGGNGTGTLLASGTVEATDARLGFETPGRISAVRAREGDAVKAGDTLALLDRSQALARRDQAEAEIQAARATLQELRSGSRQAEISQAEAALRAAEDRLDDARSDLRRLQSLASSGTVSQQAVDKAKTAVQVAESQRKQAQDRLDLVREGPRSERIRAQEARLNAARAALRGAEATLDQMVVTAPFDGVVTVRHGEPGETSAPGTPVLTLMNPADRWVRIYVREDRIGALRLGQKAEISSDTYPDSTYDGEVSFVASEAEFTPKNVQTREERVKLVFAVKVRITGDPRQELKPGMPADVRLELGSG